MASVTFTDATGAATLSNGWPAPANRFANWTPDAVPVGPRAVALGTGLTSQFQFRVDYLAAFEIDKLVSTDLSVAQRLKLHLLGGGQCTVATEDVSSNSYTCVLAPGTVPEITFSDRKRLRYSMRLAVKNTSAAHLLCQYEL